MEAIERKCPQSRWRILFIWIAVNLIVVYITAFISAEIMGLRMIMPMTMPILGIAMSILHPGGWLSLAGLITALVRRKKFWLSISVLGSIMTGIMTPIFEAIGASNM